MEHDVLWTARTNKSYRLCDMPSTYYLLTHVKGTGLKSLTTRDEGPCVYCTQSLISSTLLMVADNATIRTVVGQLITDSSQT